MSPSFLPRGDLTAHLLTTLAADGVLVGDAEAPIAGGWDDDPNAPTSSFVPYLVLNPMPVPDATGSIGDSAVDYRVPYSVTSVGISRNQTEFYADRGREKIVALERTSVTLGGGGWKIQQARANSIGGMTRNDSVEPSQFVQSDVVTIWVSKEQI